jgi:hypothetical protein
MARRRNKQRRCPAEQATASASQGAAAPSLGSLKSHGDPDRAVDPEQVGMSDPNVTRLAHWRSDREQRERSILRDGLGAAVDAFYEWVPGDQDVRLVIVAMYGDCSVAAKGSPDGEQSEPDDAQLGSVEAEFLSLDRAKPLTAAQRRHLALETTRAASMPLFREMQLGLAIADRMEKLADAAEAGDQEAATQLTVIMAALEVPDEDEPAGGPTPVRCAPDATAPPSLRPRTAGLAGR